MILIIGLYGKRNKMFHSELDKMTENKKHDSTEVVLYDGILISESAQFVNRG